MTHATSGSSYLISGNELADGKTEISNRFASALELCCAHQIPTQMTKCVVDGSNKTSGSEQIRYTVYLGRSVQSTTSTTIAATMNGMATTHGGVCFYVFRYTGLLFFAVPPRYPQTQT